MEQKKKNKVELLSPAGSYTTLKAVVNAGADAVYAAGGRFGARAYADNFSREELKDAIDFMHLHEKRFYLTVNTLLKEAELKTELYDFIAPLYRQGLDAVIVQDMGVLSFLHRCFPELEIHASTQMTITGAYGAAFLKESGCSRIVTARELSLEELADIRQSVDIEIESFIHGALCCGYSGQCLFSSLLGGRSGNRGRCAQPCRLPYRIGKTGKPSHLLSLKDLCTIELLPELLNSGICSLKIEGRMKQTGYAAGVTRIYREYLDRCLKEPRKNYSVSESDLKKLEALGNRSGFTAGYYKKSSGQSGKDMITFEKPSHTKAVNGVEGFPQKQQTDGCEQIWNQQPGREIKEKLNGKLKLLKEKPAELVLECKGTGITVTGDVVQKAKTQPMDREALKEKLKKTGNSPFCFEGLEIQTEADVFFPVGALNRLRRDGIDLLTKKLLSPFRRVEVNYQAEEAETGHTSADRKAMEETGHTVLGYEKTVLPYLSVSVERQEQILPLLQVPFVSRIYVDGHAFGTKTAVEELAGLAARIHEAGKRFYYVMPAVLRKVNTPWYEKNIKKICESGLDGFVVKNLESLQLIKPFRRPGQKIIADSGLYCWSSEAEAAWKQAGADCVTLPVELNERELEHRGFTGGEMIVYGYLPLMITAQCITKNTDGLCSRNELLFLKDRYGKEFPVRNLCGSCYNVIYNSSPLSLLHRYPQLQPLCAEGYRISFTIESNAQMEEVLNYYEAAFIRGEKIDRDRYFKDFTNGHFKRGVE